LFLICPFFAFLAIIIAIRFAIDAQGTNIQSQCVYQILDDKYDTISFSNNMCTHADLYVCIVLFSTVVSISAITAGINFPPNSKLKNHLLDVLGLFNAIFSN